MSQRSDLTFADMNIMHSPDDPHLTMMIVRRAVESGYDTIVVNTDLGMLSQRILTPSETSEPPKKKKKKGGAKMKEIPEPFLVDENKLDLTSLQTNGKIFRQYSRITASVIETGMVHSFLHHPTVRKYDVVALRPTTDKMLMTLATKTENLDMIAFDPEQKVPWLYKGKVVMMAIEKGLGIELIYSPALCDSSTRRQVLANGRQLLSATRGGRGVVLASGAIKPLDIRAPYDAANLFTLLDGTPELGRKSISANAKRVLLRAETKKTIKGAMLVQTKETSLPKDIEMLMKVPEFRAQIERLPPNDSEKSDNNLVS